MNISEYLSQNNIYIFYLCNDPERALGLNYLTANFHIVCIDHTPLFDELTGKHFCLEKFSKVYNKTFRSSAELLNNSSAMDFIDSFDGEKYIQVFKTSPKIENRCKLLNLKLLNNSAKLAQYFEDKFNLQEILTNAKLLEYIPETYLDDLSQVEFTKPIVIQLNRGHTGDGTWIIRSKEELDQLKNKLFRAMVKVSEFVEGIPININGVVTSSGVFVAGLNQQIQDKTSQIAPHLGVTLGNNYKLNSFSNEIKAHVISLTTKLGNFMHSKGYKGFFGIDLIITDNQEIKIIEINARQTANISFFNQLQIENDISPTLSELNIAEFLNLEIETDIEKYNEINYRNFEAGQIIVRNYKQKDIEYSSLKLDDRFEGFKILGRNKSHIIKPEQEIFRMQSFKELPLNESGEIRKDLFEYILQKIR